MKKTNAKEHLLDHAFKVSKTIKAAEMWIPDTLYPYGPPEEYFMDEENTVYNPTIAVLYPNLDKLEDPSAAYDLFLEMIDIDYDSGFAHGIVWFDDGSWSVLVEEQKTTWEHYQCPEMPKPITIKH